MKYDNSYKFLNFIVLNFFILFSIPAVGWHCDLISLSDLLAQNPQIGYVKCSDEIPFEYQKLPIVEDHYWHPYQGFFESSFILNIPDGQVVGDSGYVLIGDALVSELIWQNCFLGRDGLRAAQQNPIKKVSGKVAVIAMFGYQYYYHWLAEALGRLALLELHGIEYDFLYVPSGRPYIAETLALWGVDPAKIIQGSDDYILQADELIVPSLIATAKTNGCPRWTHYMPEYLLKYIKQKLMAGVDLENNPFHQSKKIFISRKDASSRRIINEDDVFALFQAQGFERYELSSLSLIEQIQLFHNADIIAGPLGSGSANYVFCKKSARIIEIFQARRDCTFYYMCQNLGLTYNGFKTRDFIDYDDGHYDTIIPLDVIQNIVKNL